MQIEHNHAIEIDINEAARRIAFAMNSAIEAGQTIEGNFTELLQVPSEQQERHSTVKLAGDVGLLGGTTSKAMDKMRRDASSAKRRATKAKNIKLPPVKGE